MSMIACMTVTFCTRIVTFHARKGSIACRNFCRLKSAQIFHRALKELDLAAVVSGTNPTMNLLGRNLVDVLDILHIFCTDHVLNLTALLAFDDATYNGDVDHVQPMKKARDLVGFFTGLTAHHIDDDWNLHATELGCFLQEGRATADALFDDLMDKIFIDCDIKELDLAAVVSDTAHLVGAADVKDVQHIHQGLAKQV